MTYFIPDEGQGAEHKKEKQNVASFEDDGKTVGPTSFQINSSAFIEENSVFVDETSFAAIFESFKAIKAADLPFQI